MCNNTSFLDKNKMLIEKKRETREKINFLLNILQIKVAAGTFLI